MNLLLSELFTSVILVETGKLSVVSLVESLILDDLKGGLVNLLEDNVESVVGSGEDGGVGDVKVGEALGLESLGTSESLCSTVFGQVGVAPSGEQVLIDRTSRLVFVDLLASGDSPYQLVPL